MAGAPSTITVYGPDDQPVQVPASEAAGLLRSGQYGLPADAAVPVQAEDGSWETVTGAEAVKRAQSYTTKLGSAADVERAQKEKEFSGAGKKALAFGSGVVDSLGVGFGDAAIVKGAELFGQGDAARQFIQDADEFAPGSRLAGKGVGFIAPLLATGGTAAAGRGAAGVAGTAARVATAPGRALIAGSEAAAEAVARTVGGQNLGRLVKPVVQQGLEMGVYGAGQAASAAVVRDPQLDGEALAAAMGQGFLHGAGMGAGVGATFGVGSLLAGRAGAAVERASGVARERLGAMVDTGLGKLRSLEARVGGELPNLAAKGEELLGTGVAKGKEFLGTGLDQITGMASQATGRVVPEAATLAGKVDRLARTAVDVEKYGTEKALQSLGADTKALREARAFTPEVQKVAARQIVEELPALVNKPGKILSHSEQAEAAILLRKKTGAKFGEVLERLDETGARIDVSAAVDLARREAVKPLRKMAGGDAYANKVDNYLADLELKSVNGELGFSDFHRQRAFLDTLIYEAKASASPARAALEKVRGVLEERFTRSADKALGGNGAGAFAAEYKALKNEYQAAAWIEETAKRTADRMGANRAWGMSEQTGAIAGAVLGGGGPLGIATAAASAMGSRAVKAHGDQFTAAVLREMQAGKPLAQALADVTRRNVGESTKKFFATVEAPARRAFEAGAERVKGAVAGARKEAGRLAAGAREGVESAIARTQAGARRVGAAAVEGAKAVGRGSARTARAVAYAADQRREFERRRKEIVAFKANEVARAGAVEQRFLRMGADPAAAKVAAESAARGAAYLARTMPAVPARMNRLQPELADDMPDPAAMEIWLRRAAVVDSPLAAVEALSRGDLEPEMVEALREAHPSFYQQTVDEVNVQLQALSEQGQVLPYDKALQIQTLFGGDVVADPTLDPGFVERWSAPPAPPAPPPVAPSRRLPARSASLYDPRQEI